MRLTRAAVAVLSLLMVAGPLALSGRTAERICPNVAVDGPWTSIGAPVFEGSADIAAFAVHPQLPFVLYASNGEQVFITDDSGCEWREFFSVELLPSLGAPVSSANSRVVAIELPENPIGPAPVYLVIEESVGPVVRPHVISAGGQNGGLDLLNGLPPTVGDVYGLHVAPSDPKVLYLHVRKDATGLQDDIYRSQDGGATWTQRNSNQATASIGMGIDPLNANDIWTWGVDGLYRSKDGGTTRSHFNQVGPPVTLVDIFHKPGSPPRIMAYEAETSTVNMTKDEGKTWTRFNGPPGFARSWAHGNEPDQLLFAQHLRVDAYKPDTFWLNVSAEYKQEDLSDLQADRSPFPSVFGFTARTIEKYTGFNDKVDLPGFTDLDPAKIVGESTLEPATTKMRLEPGGSKNVDYTFTLPPNAVPLDVFFLVDTTDSMDSSISGLRDGMQNIINELARSKIDAMFGVGEIKDYPVPGFGDPSSGDFPYRLNRAIGPANDALEAGLEAMEASGGGMADYEESQLTGLFQAATGQGEPGCAARGPDEAQPCVPAGEGANFRPDAVKVIVNITDYGFHDQAAHPSPSFDETAQSLLTEDVKQIGLAVYGRQGEVGMNAATADLAEMAEETGALAPDPVDCDGDGSTDIGAGDPLVCQVTNMLDSESMNLAPAIIATVKAVVQEVEVELVRSNGKPIAEIDPAVYPKVDVTEQNALGFGLTFTCPRSLAGSTQKLTLAAKVQGSAVATAVATVTCAKLPKAAAAKKPQPPPVPPPVAPVFPPGPVVIPALAPAGPPPVPETISSTQSAAQAQGAVAKQEQQQLQFAVAYAAFRNDEAYALSRYVEKTGPSPLPLYLSAALMSLGAYFVAMSRRRAQVALARNRRGRSD